MAEQKLPNNCLLKKTKDILEINLFKETLTKFDISGKCFLIVDKRGSIFINNYLNLTEVISKGIFSIDSIYKKRKPYKTFDAIYLVSGKKEILKIIFEEDFGKDRLYKSCHLFIIDEIKNDLYDYMAQKNFLKYIKSLKQVSIKYVTIDKNLFSFGDDKNYNSIYSLFEDNEEINNMNISSLFNICKALNIYPNIVYFNADKKCKFLAEKVNKELKNNFSKKKKEGILLITSRFIDFLAPIQFNAIYQNLLLESFKDKETKYCNKISLDKSPKNTYILDYKDELYNKYKYRFFYEVLNLVNEDVVEFKNSDVGKAITNLDKEMENAAKNLGKYKSYSQKLSQHINLCEKLNDIEKNRYLLELLDAQEAFISKKNNKGKNISEDNIISLIKENGNKFNKGDFKRLLCFIKYNFSEINLDKIYNILNLYVKFSQDDKKIINFFNSEKNQIDEQKLNDLNNDMISYREKTNYNTKEENDNKGNKSYAYIKESKLTTICDMVCKNKLPNGLFTFVEKPENLKIQKKKITTNFDNLINDSIEEENKQNLILFNLGGLSNYEISSLERGEYLGQYNMNLILGGNKVYNHEEYFNEVKDYINNKNIIKETEEKSDKNLEKKDSKINIDDKLSGSGSKEKMKKTGKNIKSNDDDTFDEDLK